MPPVADRQLQTSGSVVLNGSGNGRLTIGPSIVREYWDLAQATVSVSSTTDEATCALYRATGPTPGELLGETATGSTGDTCGLTGQTLLPGQSLLAVWTGGTPGATATMAVFGMRGRYGG